MTPPRSASPAALGEALSGIAGFGPFFVLNTGPGQGEWRPVKEVYAAGLAHLVADRAACYGTGETRIAASIVQLGHAARLWSVMLGCAVAHGVVPDLSGLRQEAEGPSLRLAVPRGWHTPEDDALAPLLYRIVMDEHLVPLAAGLRVKVAAGLLHGNAASALAEAARELVRARPDLRQPATDLARRLLDIGDLRGKGAFTGPDLSFRRRTCCLYYRVPGGGKCPDCCLAR